MSNLSVLDKGLHFNFVLSVSDDIDQASEDIKIAYERWTQHVGSGDEKILSTADVRRLPKTKLDKKQVFIFEEFGGAAFEHVRASKALVIGPRCLTSCLVEELTIPFITAPILNLAMRDMVITPSGINMQEKARIKELVNLMGAQYLEILTVSCTHLVSNTVKSEKYEKAGTVGIQIMHPDWVTEVFERSKRENILASHKDFDRHRLPIFYGLEITSTNLTADMKNRIKNAVEANGGRYTGSFKSETTNVLVLDKDKVGSEKFQAAVRYKKDCVIPQWILDSVDKGYSLPIGNYKVSLIKVSTPTKVGQAPNASQFNPDCTQLSEISHIQSLSRRNVDETVSSVASSSSARPRMSTRRNETRLPEPEYKAVIARLTLVKAKKAGAFLDGCNIYLCGFSNDEKELLNKILNIGGATRIDEVDERVTHVIIGEEVVALFTMKAHNLNPILVKLDWLEACMNAKQPVGEDQFLYRAKADTQKEPEQPSPASKKNLQSMNHSFKRPAIPKFSLNEKPSQPTQEEEEQAQGAPVDDLMGNYLAGGPAPQASVGAFSSDMYTEGSQVPFLEGKTVYIAHDSEAEYQSLAEECESAGGQVVDHKYQSIIDYVIVPFAPIQRVKVTKYRHIVNDLWWEETFKEAALLPVEYFHGPVYATAAKPLTNLNMVVSTYTGAERLYLITMGTNLGASVKEQYIKKERPILLCSGAEGAKYQAALKWKYPVVNKGWLLECDAQKALVPLDSFIVGEAVTCMPINSTQLSGAARMAPEAPVANAENIEPVPAVNLAASEDNRAARNSTTNACSPGYLRRLIAEDEACSQQMKEREEAEAAQAIKVPAPSNASTPAPRPKRISQLNPKTPITPVDSPTTALNTTDLVAELPTPNRSLIYRTLKEYEGKETPQSKRLKRLLATPGAAGTSSDDMPTPKIPDELKTPSARMYGWRDDASPDTVWMHKRKADVRDTFYRPPQPGTTKEASPTLAQIKKKFWKNALGDDYVDRDLDGAGAPHTEIDESEQMENSPKRMRSEVPPTTSRRTNAGGGEDNVKRLSEFIRNIRDDEKTTDDISNLVALDSEPVRADYDIGTAQYPEIIGWREPDEDTGRREVRKPRSKCAQPFFSFSGTPDDARVRMTSQVLELGGEVLESQNYESRCTHILCEKPSRGEKIFSGIAGGKWVLSTKYVEACVNAGFFLDEEEFEWGNPKALALPQFDGKEKDIAHAVYRWRSRIGCDNEYRHGVFTEFRVILVVSKMDQFSRLLRAGGAVILDVNPPYEGCDEALSATHCFVDEKKSKLSKSDYRTLRSAGIPVMSIMFLNSWLTSQNSDSDRYLVSID